MPRFSYGFCSPAVLTSRTTGVYMKSHARQKSKNALKRRSNFNPPRFCISAPSGSRRRPRNRRSVARFFIARPAGTPLALKESAGCLEITFNRGLCQPRPDSTFFLIRGEPHSTNGRFLPGTTNNKAAAFDILAAVERGQLQKQSGRRREQGID